MEESILPLKTKNSSEMLLLKRSGKNDNVNNLGTEGCSLQVQIWREEPWPPAGHALPLLEPSSRRDAAGGSQAGGDDQAGLSPADGSVLRLVVDVGRPDVTLHHGKKHQYRVLEKQTNPPAPEFAPDARNVLVPEDDCRRHYILFTNSGGTVKKTWMCSVCGKEFPKQYFLMRHLKAWHLSIRKFKCDKCDKAFKTRNGLVQHSVRHSSLRPYVCPVCQKAFGRVSVLLEHQRLHSDHKRFSCHCGKSFHQKVNLIAHQRVHLPTKGVRNRPTPSQARPQQSSGPKLSYRCLACGEEQASLQPFLDHKQWCKPTLSSLGQKSSSALDPQQQQDIAQTRNMDDKLLKKIQSIVQNQELLQTSGPSGRPTGGEPGAAPAAGPAAGQRAEQRAQQMAGDRTEPGPPWHRPCLLQQGRPQGRLEQERLRSRRQQRPQEQPESRPQGRLESPAPCGQQDTDAIPATVQQDLSRFRQLSGVLTVGPIRTRSMQLARDKGLQPFVLLQSGGEEPTLAKALRISDGRELLIPATTEDLRLLRRRQANITKVDLPVVAIVTQYKDADGTHLRVQPPSWEGPNCTAVSTSQIDMPLTDDEQGPASDGLEQYLSMPSGADLLSSGPDLLATSADLLPTSADLLTAAADLPPLPGPPPAADLLPARTDLLPAAADLLPAGGDTMVQFVRETPAGGFEMVSVEEAALLFSQPGSSYQVLCGEEQAATGLDRAPATVHGAG